MRRTHPQPASSNHAIRDANEAQAKTQDRSRTGGHSTTGRVAGGLASLVAATTGVLLFAQPGWAAIPSGGTDGPFPAVAAGSSFGALVALAGVLIYAALLVFPRPTA